MDPVDVMIVPIPEQNDHKEEPTYEFDEIIPIAPEESFMAGTYYHILRKASRESPKKYRMIHSERFTPENNRFLYKIKWKLREKMLLNAVRNSNIAFMERVYENAWYYFLVDVQTTNIAFSRVSENPHFVTRSRYSDAPSDAPSDPVTQAIILDNNPKMIELWFKIWARLLTEMNDMKAEYLCVITKETENLNRYKCFILMDYIFESNDLFPRVCLKKRLKLPELTSSLGPIVMRHERIRREFMIVAINTNHKDVAEFLHSIDPSLLYKVLPSFNLYKSKEMIEWIRSKYDSMVSSLENKEDLQELTNAINIGYLSGVREVLWRNPGVLYLFACRHDSARFVVSIEESECLQILKWIRGFAGKGVLKLLAYEGKNIWVLSDEYKKIKLQLWFYAR